MIYITGDCHAEYGRFNRENFPEQAGMTQEEDYVIVCGDFGYWDHSREQEWWRKWLAKKPFTLLFVDGNHENFDMLAELPIEQGWHGGKVQRISENIIHLMRGQLYELCGSKIFAFGGARSHDIRDGILELDDPDYKKKYKALSNAGALFRVNHLSWWKEEMPDEEEFEEGIRNLTANNWEVDFIITHCTASSTQAVLSGGLYEPDELTGYLDEVKRKCLYKKWFFGHYHDNMAVTDKDLLLYEQIIRIA